MTVIRDVVARSWRGYEQAVLDPQAGEVQREETRFAFYGGWRACLSMIMALMEDGEEPTDHDLEQMGAIDDELTAFIRSIR